MGLAVDSVIYPRLELTSFPWHVSSEWSDLNFPFTLSMPFKLMLIPICGRQRTHTSCRRIDFLLHSNPNWNTFLDSQSMKNLRRWKINRINPNYHGILCLTSRSVSCLQSAPCESVTTTLTPTSKKKNLAKNNDKITLMWFLSSTLTFYCRDLGLVSASLIDRTWFTFTICLILGLKLSRDIYALRSTL